MAGAVDDSTVNIIVVIIIIIIIIIYMQKVAVEPVKCFFAVDALVATS